MDTINYSIFLEEVTYDVEVLLNGELISSGSAVAINRDGDLVTAAHNIVRLNHVQEDAKEKGLIIYARSKRSNYFQYRILACAPSIGFAALREPIVIDLAIIRPIIKNITENYLEIGNILPILGEPVLMAGFSDELELPFNFDKLLDSSNEEIKGQLAKLPYSKRMLMIKSGIIGCINGFEFHNKEEKNNIEGKLFYIDNMMHFGASGGPIINRNKELVGIILKRAVTETSNESISSLPIPSGSCLGITASSTRVLFDLLAQQAH